MSDLISRQAAIEILEPHNADYEAALVIEECIARIRTVPTADAVHEDPGHWVLDIDNEYPVMMRTGWRCSECGRRETYGTTPYCPYCGRKMEVKR